MLDYNKICVCLYDISPKISVESENIIVVRIFIKVRSWIIFRKTFNRL